MYKITNKKYMLQEISETFHGRDIFAPVAAHLAEGVPIDQIGEPLHKWVDLDFGKVIRRKDRIVGEIIFVDRFGSLITNIEGKEVRSKVAFGEKVKVKGSAISFLRTYGKASMGELFATIGSYSYLELAVNQGRAEQELGLKPGEKIKINLSS